MEPKYVMSLRDKLKAIVGVITGEMVGWYSLGEQEQLVRVIDDQSELLHDQSELFHSALDELERVTQLAENLQVQFDTVAAIAHQVIGEASEHKAYDLETQFRNTTQRLERLEARLRYANDLAHEVVQAATESRQDAENFARRVAELEQQSELLKQFQMRTRKLGRKRGTLSASSLTVGTTVEDVLPFLIRARAARDREDGSFAELCRENGHSESTVREWLKRYAVEIEAATNST
jgi:hypothetical protein